MRFPHIQSCDFPTFNHAISPHSHNNDEANRNLKNTCSDPFQKNTCNDPFQKNTCSDPFQKWKMIVH
ncbi:unnamed protein product, partial [Onchocerca flexuosa]|uniref:Ovule protein n=1 Tax=Onchocerca flexuosa TaxID=387005 RepID=A0A183HGC1_9BILA